MTDQQINQRIAEACGWTDIHDSGPWHYHTLWGYPPIKPGQGGNAYKYLPNYCGDLNAMHEAESTLNEDQLWQMAREIEKNWEDQWYFRATAHQRAEAFLRTLGKWEEVSK
jgi:hypothetical protein